MPKTIKLLFVKTNNIAYLLEGEDLKTYQALHNKAIAAYKKTKGIIDTVKGRRCSCQIIELQSINAEEKEALTDKIVIFKDNGAIILLEGQAYQDYNQCHFTGLSLLADKEKQIQITGKLVKVNLS